LPRLQIVNRHRQSPARYCLDDVCLGVRPWPPSPVLGLRPAGRTILSPPRTPSRSRSNASSSVSAVTIRRQADPSAERRLSRHDGASRGRRGNSRSGKTHLDTRDAAARSGPTTLKSPGTFCANRTGGLWIPMGIGPPSLPVRMGAAPDRVG
jgi:hypothetical protein